MPTQTYPIPSAADGSYSSNRSAVGLNADVTPLTPSRRILVIAIATVTSANGANGNINALSDSASTPTTLRARVGNQNGNVASQVVRGTLSFAVEAGHNYRFETESLSGTPTYGLTSVLEVPL